MKNLVRWLKTRDQACTVPDLDCIPVKQLPCAASRIVFVYTIRKVIAVNDVAVFSNLKQPIGVLLHRSSPKWTRAYNWPREKKFRVAFNDNNWRTLDWLFPPHPVSDSLGRGA